MSRLVVTRKDGQAVIIDGNIRISVKQLHRGYTEVAIEAPPEVKILREELVLRDAEAQNDRR